MLNIIYKSFNIFNFQMKNIMHISKLFLFLLIPSAVSAMSPDQLLHHAAKNMLQPGYTTIVEQARDALARGAQVNECNCGLPALHKAAIHNLVDLAQFLIDNEAIVDHLSYSETTPMHLAIACGNLSIIKLLLDNRADVNMRNGLNQTPLHESLKYGYKGSNVPAIRLLLEHGADIHAQDDFGKTPLSIVRTANYRDPKNAQIIHRYAAHPAILPCTTALACMNHPRTGAQTSIQNQGAILPYDVMQCINKLLHKDAGVNPADY